MVFATLAATLVPLLAQKGLGLLSDVLGSATDSGVNLVKNKIKDVTGIDITDQKQVENLTPEQVITLKKVEIDHEEFLVKVALQESELYLKDRQDARDMQKIALQQDDKFAKRFVPILGAITIAICLGYAIAITFVPIPADNIRFADTTLGFALGTGVATILNFFFGTSRSSEQKTEHIAQLMIGQKKTQATIPQPKTKLEALAEKYGF